jgi:putative transposase
MSSYRRSHGGQVYFFTVVTYERKPLLTSELARKHLRSAFQFTQRERPFIMTAVVLLPDHLHAIWELPAGDTDYSTRWRRVKGVFTQEWLANGGENGMVSQSRVKRSEQGVWQRRFFEHTCRDETDLKRCLDYIHINPMKHGLAGRAGDWPWSSFHRDVNLGEYPPDWRGSAEFYGDEFRCAE